MFVIVSEGRVPAAAECVWALVTGFARYPLWTRSVELDGAPDRGAPLSYAFRVWRADGSDHRVVFPAIVDAAIPGRALIWSLGVPGVFVLKFRFDLLADGHGTIVRHTIEAAGLLTPALRGRLERRLGPVVRALVADAERAFTLAPRPRPGSAPDWRH